MSDSDPEVELPDFLSEAILSEGPPQRAVEVLKDAFVWRTIEADLLELSFDSDLEPAGVRDADASRTLELAADAMSVVIEVGPDDLVRGQVVPAATGTVELRGLGQTSTAVVDADGRFAFAEAIAGPVRLRLVVTATFESQTFLI